MIDTKAVRVMQALTVAGKKARRKQEKKTLEARVIKVDGLMTEAAARGEEFLKYDGVWIPTSGKKHLPKYSLLEGIALHYRKLGFDTSIVRPPLGEIAHTFITIKWTSHDPREIL